MARDTKGDDSDAVDRERGVDTHGAGKLLGVSELTMRKLRLRGEGPRFYRVGTRAIRYRIGDVLDYRDAATVGKRSLP